MSVSDVIEVAAIGSAAGVLAGMFGVGGGVLFVPTLTFVFGLGQVEAEGTSLLAMIPVALMGTYGNWRRGLINPRKVVAIGLFAAVGAVIGAAFAHQIPEQLLRKCFGAFLFIVAIQLVRRAINLRRLRLDQVQRLP